MCSSVTWLFRLVFGYGCDGCIVWFCIWFIVALLVVCVVWVFILYFFCFDWLIVLLFVGV